MNRFKRRGGYFLIEIAFFLIFCVFLAAVATMNLSKVTDDAKYNKALLETSQIGAAVSQYHYDSGVYPTDLTVLTKAGTGTLKGYGPWIPEINKDPWGKSYKIVSNTNEFVVYSGGKSGKTNTSASSVAADVIGYHGR